MSPSRAKSVPNNILQDECCGWLWKKTGRFSGWKRRFFSLRGPILQYYDKFPAEEYIGSASAGSVTVSGVGYAPVKNETIAKGVLRVAHVETSKGSNVGFKIFGVSGKVIDIRGDNQRTVDKWVKSLQTAAILGQRKEINNLSSLVSTSKDSCSTEGSTLGSLSDEIGRMSNFVDKCGWLNRKEGSSWKSFYFVLQGSMLSYHDDDLPWTVPNGRAYVIKANNISGSNTEVKVELSTDKEIVLQAASREERDAWLEALLS